MEQRSGSVINLTLYFFQPYYIAPEVLQSSYNEKCDLWSIGVVLYVLLCGKPPFPGDSQKEIIENVISGIYHFEYTPFKYVSEEAKELIRRLLVIDVGERLSAADAYEYPWIKNANENCTDAICGDAYENIVQFMHAVKLKKTALTFLAQKLPEYYVEDLRQAFISIDDNGDGRISGDELRKAFNSLNIKYTDQDISEIISTIDTNHNGSIDYTEFLAACMKAKIYLKETNVRAAFDFFDRVNISTN